MSAYGLPLAKAGRVLGDRNAGPGRPLPPNISALRLSARGAGVLVRSTPIDHARTEIHVNAE